MLRVLGLSKYNLLSLIPTMTSVGAIYLRALLSSSIYGSNLGGQSWDIKERSTFMSKFLSFLSVFNNIYLYCVSF